MEGSQVYTWENRKYVRLGECVRCGECCRGWGTGPCQYLVLPPGEQATCLVYGKSAQEVTDASCNLEGVWVFPDGPQALWWDHDLYRKCGYWFVEVERILVACPTYAGKDYCKERYLAAYEALDWPAKDLLMVDTTDYPGNGNEKIAKGMEEIRQAFLAGPYDRWLNLEADVIVPPDTIKVLLSYDRAKNLDWISHYYPNRVNGEPGMSGFGCSLFSRRLLERHSFEGAPAETTTDGWWWNTKVKPDTSIKCLELWGVLQLEHLNG